MHECFFFNKVLNIWKSYMWTAEWRIKWRMIMAVIYATFAVAKRKPETKKFRQVRDSNPWPLRYQAWIFFRLSCSNYKSCVCNCDDHRSFKCFLLLLPLLLLLSCFVSLWNCNVLGFHVMKEREPNSKTPHRNFNSMSDETHGKSELTVHKQSRGYKRNKKRREVKSMRMIHSTLGSRSNTVCVQGP